MALSKESTLDRLRAAHARGQLAHAFLVTGPAGSGKSWLATELAAMALDCSSNQVAAHPDAHVVRPESKSRRIVIEQIRKLDHSIQRKPLVGSMKVAIIHDAERMQPQAANAFLKTLEEPPPGSLLLLLTTLPEALLETVLSRCIETPLAGGPAVAGTPEEQAIHRALDDNLVKPAEPGVAEGFRMTRTVQSLLSDIRESVVESHEAQLKDEAAKYKQVAGAADWIEERAAQVKALSEATALSERERLLNLVADALGRALRARHGHSEPSPVLNALANRYDAPALLRRIDALERLRRRLALGVQESLALESGLLEIIEGR